MVNEHYPVRSSAEIGLAEERKPRYRDQDRGREERRTRRGGDHANLITLRLSSSENGACNAVIAVVTSTGETRNIFFRGCRSSS